MAGWLQVVREVYFPETGVWLADYPYLNRDAFLGISLEVERARAAAASGMDGMGGMPPSPAGSGPDGTGSNSSGSGSDGSYQQYPPYTQYPPTGDAAPY